MVPMGYARLILSVGWEHLFEVCGIRVIRSLTDISLDSCLDASLGVSSVCWIEHIRKGLTGVDSMYNERLADLDRVPKAR
jgi:hypothetical protein